MVRRRFVALIALSAALFAADLSEAAETGPRVQETVLQNGLKVLVVEEPKAPVITVQIWYKVGSRNEIMGRAGLSHMLEHMMFKGTKKYAKGEFSKIIKKNGGNDNAFTSQDYTAYFENLAADKLELALEMESDRLQGLLLDDNEFQLEREVVKEERRLRTEDNPQAYLVEQMFAQAFMEHPYHWPIIGWFNDLNAMTREDLKQHYEQRHVGDRGRRQERGRRQLGQAILRTSAQRCAPHVPGDHRSCAARRTTRDRQTGGPIAVSLLRVQGAELHEHRCPCVGRS